MVHVDAHIPYGWEHSGLKKLLCRLSVLHKKNCVLFLTWKLKYIKSQFVWEIVAISNFLGGVSVYQDVNFEFLFVADDVKPVAGSF